MVNINSKSNSDNINFSFIGTDKNSTDIIFDKSYKLSDLK